MGYFESLYLFLVFFCRQLILFNGLLGLFWDLGMVTIAYFLG